MKLLYIAIFALIVALAVSGLTSIPAPLPMCLEPLTTFCKNLVPADVEDVLEED